ncbi:MAG: hypothetical protein KTR13_05185 [Saprospiraceae bacterium]|nr:hypothetical protein [Saprospiraceae bacterium]
MRSIHLLLIFCLFACKSAAPTTEVAPELQGYTIDQDNVTFIFSPDLYAVSPSKVVVTGMFRDWSQDMDNAAWQLKPNGNQWTLTVDNSDQLIQPQHTFKFRIDDGTWLDPPSHAPNLKGSDLVFEAHVQALTLHSEVVNETTIELTFSSPTTPKMEDFTLYNTEDEVVPLKALQQQSETTFILQTVSPIAIKQPHFITYKKLDIKQHCSYDGWFKQLYSDKALGANIVNGKTEIRLFAPRAESVKVYLFESRTGQRREVRTLVEDENGVWETTFDEDLSGLYYDFSIHGKTAPGNHFYSTTPIHFTDPYARVSDNTWGRARIWPKTEPATPLKNGIPKLEDVIAYEVHVQDFTDQLPVDPSIKGTIPAMTVRGLKNANGEKIGFDYLLDLGINVLHLMPMQEYLHFPDDDWKASFQNDTYMIEQGISEENYQWGYRTSHAFAVESKYRTKGKEPGTEREEFRDLVQAFHDEGIAVIIDIVPNHTVENMVEQEQYFNFNAIDKQYYYRTKDFSHIGEYGNEVKTENRPMVRRWLIDQCKHWIEEFGIDGFRIDLAGQIDEQSLIALKEALGPDIIVYGEAWIGSNDPAFEANPDWDWYKADAPITFFQDDSRNAYKGPVFELNDKLKDRGWPGGKYDERGNVMKGLANKFPDDDTPLSGISYLDIHDNFALADQFATTDFDGRYAVDQDLYKIATTLLYTSLGPIVTHGGSEIMRSKAHAPLMEVEKTTRRGFKQYMHGKRDTYNHRTANQFIWQQVGQEPAGKNQNDYKNMHAFWKGMNTFRMSEYGRVFRVSEPVSEDYFTFFTPDKKHLLGYLVDDQVFILLNAASEAGSFESIQLPAGQWKLIVTNQKVDINGWGEYLDAAQTSFELPQQSLRIWVKD